MTEEKKPRRKRRTKEEIEADKAAKEAAKAAEEATRIADLALDIQHLIVGHKPDVRARTEYSLGIRKLHDAGLLSVDDDGKLSDALQRLSDELPSKHEDVQLKRKSKDYAAAFVLAMSNVVDDLPDIDELSARLEQIKLSDLVNDEPIAAAIYRFTPDATHDELSKLSDWVWKQDGVELRAVTIATATDLLKSHRAACALDRDFLFAIESLLHHKVLDKAEAARALTQALPDGFTDPPPVPIGNQGAMIHVWYDGIEIEEGHFYLGMPNEVYHSHECISNSGLTKLSQSPAHYFFAPKEERSRYMEIGAAIHTAILEPDLFDEQYVIVKGIRTRVASEYKQMAKVHGGEFTLTEQEGALIIGMQGSLYGHPEARKYLLAEGYNEISGFVRLNTSTSERMLLTQRVLKGCTCDDGDDVCACGYLQAVEGLEQIPSVDDGPLVRVRFDKLIPGPSGMIAFDLKKTQDARSDAFSRSVFRYRYHVQAAFYSWAYREITGEDLAAFLFCAIEERPPHGLKMYLLDNEAIALGVQTAREDIVTYERCYNNHEWPAYDTAPELISLPKWATRDIEIEDEQ